MILEKDVCIVGAGPGGALLGLLLAKQGISVSVLERHTGIDKEFRGEHLNQEGEAILRQYGLYEKVEHEGLLLMERVEYWQDGKAFKTISPSGDERHVGIHVPQRNLLSILLGESQVFPHYRLEIGAKVTDIYYDENHSHMVVKAKKDSQEVTVHCKVVIGADGRFSTVRKLTGIPYSTYKHGYDLLWAKIQSPSGWEPTIRQALIQQKQLALFTQAGGYVQIGWNIEEGAFPLLRKQSFEPFLQLAIDAFPDLENSLRKQIHSWNDFILLNVHSSQCETWVQDGVVLMGDAAHTMSPTGAYGINAALADANVLSELLVDALQAGDVSMERLKQFETQRWDAVLTLQKMQRLKEETYIENFPVPASV
ncbi:FAD-dependent monooxygenase [Mesobacillus maritimus]|uniref:FAD-dependent monooxygenase n=1 Tax=Mesobacillus maritimus TaxID=1643336 RepID=UPI002041DF78|nr:FAD-dependent monooxygenase [Mesobacillus maritimus]